MSGVATSESDPGREPGSRRVGARLPAKPVAGRVAAASTRIRPDSSENGRRHVGMRRGIERSTSVGVWSAHSTSRGEHPCLTRLTSRNTGRAGSNATSRRSAIRAPPSTSPDRGAGSVPSGPCVVHGPGGHVLHIPGPGCLGGRRRTPLGVQRVRRRNGHGGSSVRCPDDSPGVEIRGCTFQPRRHARPVVTRHLARPSIC